MAVALNGSILYLGFFFFFACASAAATEHWTCFAFLHRQPPHNYVSLMLWLHYHTYMRNLGRCHLLISLRHFPNAQQHSFVSVNARLTSIIRGCRLSMCSSRRWRFALPRRLISPKHIFFSSILSAWAPPLFAAEQRRLLILKQPTSPIDLHRIRLTCPWSGCDHVHLKGILVYTSRVDGKWILYFLVSSSVSSVSRRQSGRKQGTPAPTWKWDESLSPHAVVCLLPPSPPLTLLPPPPSAFVLQAGALHSGASGGTTSRPLRWLKCRISSEFSARADEILSAGVISTRERQLCTYC